MGDTTEPASSNRRGLFRSRARANAEREQPTMHPEDRDSDELAAVLAEIEAEDAAAGTTTEAEPTGEVEGEAGEANPTETKPEAAQPTDAAAASKTESNPKRVIRDLRRMQARTLAENERLRAELAARPAVADPDAIGEQDLAVLDEIADDVPAAAKAAKVLRAKLAEKPAPTAKPDPEFQPRALPQEAQAIVDEVDELLEWQHDPDQQDRFARAIAHDGVLANHPKWKDVDVVERAREAARRVIAEDVDASPNPKPKPSAATPQQIRASVRRTAPTTLSDISGGDDNAGTDDPFTEDLLAKMSDDDILLRVRLGQI